MYREYSIATNSLITDNAIQYRVLWDADNLWATQQISWSIKSKSFAERDYTARTSERFALHAGWDSRNNLFPDVYRFPLDREIHKAGHHSRATSLPPPTWSTLDSFNITEAEVQVNESAEQMAAVGSGIFCFCRAHPAVLQKWQTVIKLFVSIKNNKILLF